MKKAEAISILATSVRPREAKDRARYDEAVKMAIEALKRSETPNSSTDCISRQAAIDLLKQMRKDGDMIPWEGKDVFARIRKLPSAQPEIVRCKDCRWRKDQSGSTAWLPCRAIVTPSDFYCGRAERRTDEE